MAPDAIGFGVPVENIVSRSNLIMPSPVDVETLHTKKYSEGISISPIAPIRGLDGHIIAHVADPVLIAAVAVGITDMLVKLADPAKPCVHCESL